MTPAICGAWSNQKPCAAGGDVLCVRAHSCFIDSVHQLTMSDVTGSSYTCCTHQVKAERGSFGTAIDLGCGLGSMGRLFLQPEPQLVHQVTGVDLSKRMLQFAAADNLYDELILGEAVQEVSSANIAQAYKRPSHVTLCVSRLLRAGALCYVIDF